MTKYANQASHHACLNVIFCPHRCIFSLSGLGHNKAPF